MVLVDLLAGACFEHHAPEWPTDRLEIFRYVGVLVAQHVMTVLDLAIEHVQLVGGFLLELLHSSPALGDGRLEIGVHFLTKIPRLCSLKNNTITQLRQS